MTDFDQHLSSRLDERKAQGLYRQRKILGSPQDVEVLIEGKKHLSFCSNDYLGLANHPDVIQAFKDGIDEFGVGSGASHLITGHSAAHHALEEALANFTGRPRALLFSSGYMANVGVISTLLSKQDQVFEDKLNHASLIDGGLFSNSRFKRYSHLDMDSLKNEMRKAHPLREQGKALIVSDGVFSMDGDVAPLPELIAIAKEHDAQLMIDDAHGFGCLGLNGGGLAALTQEQGVDTDESALHILMGTLGKAFGTSGAFVTGSEELIENLIQFCRPYIYTTAMPPAVAVATLCSLQIIQKESWRREYLQSMIQDFRAHCLDLGFSLTNSDSPIQALIIGDVENTLKASQILEGNGIIVSAIRPPTVAQGSARLRFTFSASHTKEQFSTLLNSLESLVPFANGESV